MRLSPEDRDLFGTISDSIRANPFSVARLRSDAAAVGMPWDHEHEEVVEALRAELERRLEAMGPEARVPDFEGRDADLVFHALAFWALHAWWEDFQDLLDRQLASPDEPVEAPFVDEILAALAGWQLGTERAVRLIGLFHQIHRAYTFIGQRLLGQAPSMRALRERLWVNVFTHDLELYVEALWDRLDDFSTFLVGASGAGKGAAAVALGHSGWIPLDTKRSRFAASFPRLLVPIHLAEFPDTLLESELFGHVRGAFTGAIKDQDGVLARCQRHGSLFLDEIGEVAEHVQVKLLRVLQERRYTPVGSRRAQTFQGRIIAATNRPLAELRSAQGLREDFFYRLCSDIIEVPPLRQRLEEDPAELSLLVEHLIARMVGPEASDALGARVLDALEQGLPPGYPWPGNVRELEQMVRRVLLTGQPPAAGPARPGDDFDALAERMRRGELSAQALQEGYCQALHARLGSYQAVARQIDLDRRTVSKYVRQREPS